jgi:hypothetical protein
MSHELPAGALVDSVHVWEPGGSLPLDTRWRVAAVDAYGNAAAETSGVFVVTGVSGDGALPARPALAEAYPNPFNPRVTLRYALPRAQAVLVAVYDLAGRRVAVLYRGRQEAGWHEAEWDATGIPSGSYLARLETARGTAGRKIMLVK